MQTTPLTPEERYGILRGYHDALSDATPLTVSREGVFASPLPDGEVTWPFE